MLPHPFWLSFNWAVGVVWLNKVKHFVLVTPTDKEPSLPSLNDISHCRARTRVGSQEWGLWVLLLFFFFFFRSSRLFGPVGSQSCFPRWRLLLGSVSCSTLWWLLALKGGAARSSRLLAVPGRRGRFYVIVAAYRVLPHAHE